MRLTKDRLVLIWSLVILGLPLVAPGCVHHGKQRNGLDAAVQEAGPEPNATLMYLAITAAAGRTPDSPADLYDLEVDKPILAPGEAPCWQVPFKYRLPAQDGAGLVICHGSFWVRHGRLLRAQWNSSKARP